VTGLFSVTVAMDDNSIVFNFAFCVFLYNCSIISNTVHMSEERKMKSFSYVIKDSVGVHARPAAILVQEAKKYLSEVQIEANGKKANMKGILGLMTLGVKQGMKVTITAAGEDETRAIQGLTECLTKNL
jgi:phosphocarrier protein